MNTAPVSPERGHEPEHDPHRPSETRPAEDPLGFELPPPVRVSPTRVIAAVLGVGALLGVAFTAGYLPRRQARVALAETARIEGAARPRIEVLVPRPGASDRALALPGSVHPLEETVVYPRANGYVRRWLVDIGDRVTEGQLLAEVETPELDQELLQARAQLAQAQAGVQQADANREFAQAELTRYRQLAPSGIASRQEFEQRQAAAAVSNANVAVARAAVGAARANIQRIQQLKAFARVVAPFAGTVTSRTVERGALVSAGTTTPLFRIAAVDPVRVIVQVPQDVAPSVRPGVLAHVAVREYPGRVFEGTVARAAGALDSASRTMSTEVRVSNTDGALLAGMYTEVSFTLPAPHRVLEVPATAIISDASGLRVAVVGEGGRVHLQPVTVERDTGATVQVASGLTGDERVARIGSAELSEGTVVDVVQQGTGTGTGTGGH